MSLSISSDILQYDANMLEEQWYEMQRRHEEELWFQAVLEEAAEAHHVECVTQKARKMIEAKIREESKKWRLVEEEYKRKWIKYLQQL